MRPKITFTNEKVELELFSNWNDKYITWRPVGSKESTAVYPDKNTEPSLRKLWDEMVNSANHTNVNFRHGNIRS